MFKKTIEYVDLEGNDTTAEAEFHVNPREIEMLNGKTHGGQPLLMSIMDNLDHLNEAVKNERADEDTIVRMFRLVDDVARISYGQRVSKIDPVTGNTVDTFVRNDEATELFLQTEAWHALSFELVNDSDKLMEFFNKVLPQRTLDLINEAAKKVAEQNAEITEN